MNFQNLLFPETTRQEHLQAFLLVTCATVAFFWPAIINGDVIMGHDIVTHFYSARGFFRESIFSGEFPLWCPYPAGGTYFAVNTAQQCYYPFILCYIVFPLTYGFTVYIVIHFILFSFFFYLLARECGISYPGALFCALTSFMAGTPLSFVMFPEFVAGLTWYPVVLLTFIKLLKNTTLSNSVWLALAFGMQVLGGSPYAPFYSIVSMAIIAVCYIIANRTPIRAAIKKLFYAVGAGAGAFLLSAPIMIPMLAIYKSIREFGLDGLFPPSFSMRLADWVPAIMPFTLGYEDHVKCFYIGLLPLLIIGLAAYWFICKIVLPSARNDEGGQTGLYRIGIMFGVLALGGFILSFGYYLGIDSFLIKIPIIGRINRWPSWIAFLFVSGMSVLSGVAFDTLIRLRQNKSLRTAALPLLLAGIVVGIILFIFRNSAAGLMESFRATYWRYIHSAYFIPEIHNLNNYPPSGVIMRFSFFLVAGCGILLLAVRVKWKPSIIIMLLAACLITDKALFYSTRGSSHTSKTDIFKEVPQIVTYIKEQERNGSLFRIDMPQHLDHVSMVALNSRRSEDYRFIRERMVSVVGMQYHLYTTSYLAALREGGLGFVVDPWLKSLPPQTRERMLGLWNVKYMLDMAITSDRRLDFTFNTNPHFAPRAWISYSKYPMPTLRDCLGLMQNSSFNARETVLLVEPGIKTQVLNGTPGTADVETIKYTNNTVTITATAERDGYLYLSDTYADGWRAYIDDKRTKLYRANMNGRAVAFPAGTHTIYFKYSPPSFWVGLWLGVIAWPAAAAFLVLRYRKDRRKQSPIL